MQPERSVGVARLIAADLHPGAQRLSRTSLEAGPISLLPRTLEPFILHAIDSIPVAALPCLRLEGTGFSMKAALHGAFIASEFAPDWLADWMSDDIAFLAHLFQDLTGAQTVQVRLEAVDDDGCRRFHADAVHFRLVTTYRGPGTQWISPRALCGRAPASPVSREAIRQLDRGTVAILRGSKGETPERPSLLHRSPPIEGSNIVRLFLAIDDAADHDHSTQEKSHDQ
ncbi:hypothetical protein FHS85_000382 [Rhodoligotrophos appendicifer]|uniref:DUF1826 domain-containing protein n=1 Tax=Rhodoligotrophos appendicifer TaxID=987056 RepID=UPI00117FEBD5|nr:DUF1826 domain-containing protein [Rhodoligotrophos appendicifer]